MGHLLVSVAALVVVIAWWRAGTRPNAELEGLFALFAVALAIPVAGFTLAAAHCVRLAFGPHPTESGWSLLLGLVEAAVGFAFTVVVVTSVVNFHETSVSLGQVTSPWNDIVAAPARFLVLPAVLLLILGVTTLCTRLLEAAHRTADPG